jgi:aminopeptidase N
MCVPRKLVPFAVLLALMLAACRGQPATPVPTEEAARSPAPGATAKPTLVPQAEVSWGDRSAFGGGLIAEEQGVLDELPGATEYHIDLFIPEDIDALEGHEEIRYTNRESVSLDEVYFRLFANANGGQITVSEVMVDGQEVETAYEFEQSALRVALPAPLEVGDQVAIEMGFQVEIPREMGGNYGLFGYFDDILVLDEFYPVVAVYDDEGWNVEDPPPAGDLTYFDASFYLVQVTAPADLVVVASGVEVDGETEGEEQILTFAAGPARDFYLAASERYVAKSEQVGETLVNSYAFPEREEHALLALQYAVDALGSYNERFGVYPYVEFDVASTPMQALGMEYPGIVGLGLLLYDPEAEVWGLSSQIMLEGSVAHEVGHQWFYNVVGNDQVDEPWLDEALVQYITGLYYLDVAGERALEGWSGSWYDRWQRADMADIPIGLPSGEYSNGTEYGAIVYGRGPIFMDTLAKQMGQETFDQFLRDYYQSHKWDIGTAEDFQELAEQHCQCDLSSLFEDWVYER